MIYMSLCDIPKSFYKKSPFTDALIYLTEDGDIIKSIPVDGNKEYQVVKDIYPKLRESEVKMLFADIKEVEKCDKYHFYLMKRYDYDVDGQFLSLITKKDSKNVLEQILLALFYLNHELEMYHNDLYYKDTIRNVMYIKTDTPVTVKWDNFEVICERFISKIIDFGWAESRPAFRTSQYQKELFPENKVVSELVLFSYFYFITILPRDKDFLLNILQKLTKIIEKRLENENKLDKYHFDKMFYDIILSYYDKIVPNGDY